MVDEHVLAVEHREDGDALVALDRHEGRRHQRGPRLVVELGAVDGVDGPHAAEPEGPLVVVDVVGLEAEVGGEALHRRRGELGVDLQADDREEAPAAELLLEGEQQVVGGVVVEGQVGVAGDPEDARGAQRHAGEELAEVGDQDLLERGEPVALGEGQQAGDVGGDLDPGEPDGVVGGVADLDAHVERQVGDVREGVAGVDGERGDHRQDQPVEELVEVLAVRGAEVLPVDDLDPLGGQGRQQLVDEERLVPADHVPEGLADVAEQLLGGAPVGGAALDAGHHLALQPRHLDLEELVDPLGEEDQELHPLEEGDLVVVHQVEQAVVEVQVGELPGEVPGRLRMVVGGRARRRWSVLRSWPTIPGIRAGAPGPGTPGLGQTQGEAPDRAGTPDHDAKEGSNR